jgi:hypothetical protein
MEPYQIVVEHDTKTNKVSIRLTNVDKTYILDWTNYNIGLQDAFTLIGAPHNNQG